MQAHLVWISVASLVPMLHLSLPWFLGGVFGLTELVAACEVSVGPDVRVVGT